MNFLSIKIRNSVVIILIFVIIFALMPMFSVDTYAKSKVPGKPTFTTATISGNTVTLKWKKLNCTGYKIYKSINDEGQFCIKTLKASKTSFTEKLDDSININNDVVSYELFAYNSIKVKKYYNSKKHKWQSKKPKKSEWKGKKTKIVNEYHNGRSIEKVFYDDPRDHVDYSAEEYARMFTDKWYGLLQERLASRNAATKKSYTYRENMILEKDFWELSDAMKIYALNKSDYFGCVFDIDSHPLKYGFVYDKEASFDLDLEYRTEAVQMKYLYEGNARGVCQDYAVCELSYFKLIGIEAYYNSGNLGNGDHAWSVIFVKNSEGKKICIPFDYGFNYSEKNYNGKIWAETKFDKLTNGLKQAEGYECPSLNDFN